jgi:hypothetical protein
MQLKRFVLLFLVGCLFTLAASTVLAQLELAETYTAADDSFEFMYPSDWKVTDDGYEDSGFVLLTGNISRDLVNMAFVSPDTIASWLNDIDELDSAVEWFATVYDFDNETELEIDGRATVTADFALDATTGLAFVIEMDQGGFGLILIVSTPGDALADLTEEIVQIVATFDRVGGNEDEGSIANILSNRGGMEDENNSSTVTSLNDYASDDWRDAIAELEGEGFIGSGGILVFNENRAYFDGIGSWFTPLARRALRRDVVMAAEIDFNTDSGDFESCSLLARIVTDPNSGTITTFLEVGIDNEGDVYWVDRENSDVYSGLIPLGLDLNDPHHFLFLALDDTLTIYVDGELIFDKVAIQSRSGSFGIALVGKGADSRCEGDNIWAYDAPIFIPGLCEVTASGTVNKRSGPGTNFDRAGTLDAGGRVEVMSQAEDDSGFVWYELEDDSWVREDIVSLMGDCGNIPDN